MLVSLERLSCSGNVCKVLAEMPLAEINIITWVEYFMGTSFEERNLKIVEDSEYFINKFIRISVKDAGYLHMWYILHKIEICLFSS